MSDKISQAAEECAREINDDAHYSENLTCPSVDTMTVRIERAMRKLLAQLDEARLQINIQEVMPQPAPIAGEGELRKTMLDAIIKAWQLADYDSPMAHLQREPIVDVLLPLIRAYVAERTDAATLAEHKSHIEYENELYATLVDPLAEGPIKEAEMRPSEVLVNSIAPAGLSVEVSASRGVTWDKMEKV